MGIPNRTRKHLQAFANPSINMSGEEVNAKFIEVVSKRSGGGGILGLSRNFKIIDRDGSGTLTIDEFKLAMKKFQVGFSDEESETLFNFYDSKGEGDGKLDFDEFLKGLRGQMNDMRRELCEQAFAAMDADGSGELDLPDVVSKYNTSKHEKVISGEWTHEQACEEFLMAFEGEDGNRDGKVTMQEFMDYNSAFSSNIDEDDAFGMMMASNWGIEFVPKKEILEIFDIIKTKSDAKGGGKKAAKDAFKYFDTDNSGMIEMPEFEKAMKTFNATLTDPQVNTMFGMFDQDNSGTISIEELLDVVFTPGGPKI